MLFQLKKLPEIINLTRFLKSFWILYIDQIIVYNAFYSKLNFYIIKDRCQMHTLKVFRSPVWLLLHRLSSPHYPYIRKMRRGNRLPLTQNDYFIKIMFLLSKWFQTRTFLWEFPIGSYVKLSSAVAATLVGVLKCRTHFWKRTTQESFQQSLVEIGSVVSEEKIFFKFHPPFFLICIIGQNRQKFKVHKKSCNIG